MTSRLSLLLLALLFSLPVTAQDWRPVSSGDAFHTDLHGVWQSHGYGWLLTVEADQARMYNISPAGCLPDDQTSQYLADGSGVFRFDGDTLHLSAFETNSSRYTFDRLAALPAMCEAPPGTSPREVFDYAWTVMNRHYAFFDLYSVDWHARYEAIAPTLRDDTSGEELRDAILAMLDGLDDNHLTFSWVIDGNEDDYSARPPRQLRSALRAAFAEQDEIERIGQFGNQWFFANRNRIRDELLGGEFETASGGNVFWGRIGDIGYLNIAGMGGFAETEDDSDATLAVETAAVHATMERVLADLGDTKAMIVDVALNQGGYDDVSLAISSHFASRPTPAVTKYAHTAPGATRQILSVIPTGSIYTKPVVVLTSEVTVSAAETFTMQMRALPTVTHVGETTRGALSDVLFRPLPNGWLLTLSNEVYLDHAGMLWEGRGILPEEPMVLFADGDIHGHVEAIRTLAAQLQDE
ncbi:MAG: S41 family peptidase [Bacteroidota bacterium]